MIFEARLLTAQTQEEVLSSQKLERSAGLGAGCFCVHSLKFKHFQSVHGHQVEVNDLLNS